MGYSFAASSRGAALLRLFWYSSSVSSCSCKFPLRFSVIPPLRSCALAANLACPSLLCPAQHTIPGAHTHSRAQSLHTSKAQPNMRIFTWKRGLACPCLFLLEAIWKATQQKLCAAFMPPLNIEHTFRHIWNSALCTRCFVMGQGIRKELRMVTRNTRLQQAKIKSLG